MTEASVFIFAFGSESTKTTLNTVIKYTDT